LPFRGEVVVVGAGAEFTTASDFLTLPGATDLFPLGLVVVVTGVVVARLVGFLPGFPAVCVARGRVAGLATPALGRAANVRAPPRRGPSPIALTGLLVAGLLLGVGSARTAA
jgi:hypothetical protein